jgi:hypothetical protein
MRSVGDAAVMNVVRLCVVVCDVWRVKVCRKSSSARSRHWNSGMGMDDPAQSVWRLGI